MGVQVEPEYALLAKQKMTNVPIYKAFSENTLI
jgi:hypothetical protein